MAQRELPAERLPEIRGRFRPIIGEEQHAGSYRGTFYAGRVRDKRAINTGIVKELLIDAGVAEGNIIIEPSEFADNLPGNTIREDMIISPQDFILLEQHIDNLLRTKNVPKTPTR